MGEVEVRDSDADSTAELEEGDFDEQVIEEENEIKKKRKPGMIYLSNIPNGFNVMKIRLQFSVHGKVNRIFLQPGISKNVKNKLVKQSKTKRLTYFTEGWVEFESKRVAKLVAENLNNTLVGGSKKSKAHSQIWNIKYLPRFKWAHLNERLAYEKATRRQRMRAEVFQAKKESNYFANNVEKSEKVTKWKKKNVTDKNAETDDVDVFFPKQRQLEPVEKKVGAVKVKKNKMNETNRKEFLSDLFG